MMTPQIMRILKKLYSYKNRYHNDQGEPCYSEEYLSEKEKILLREYGWKTNDVVSFWGHEDILNKLHTLKEHSALTKKRCLDAFISGIGGSYPRGLSVLPAWHILECCTTHSYEQKEQYACCWICGQRDEYICLNNAYTQYCLYLGNSYSSTPLYAYLNLKHLSEVPAMEPTKDDIITVSALLDLLRNAPEDETPGKFEKRLQEATRSALYLKKKTETFWMKVHTKFCRLSVKEI